MESETTRPMDFSDFVKQCVFPQCVCVTEGNFLSKDVQISIGDVLLLRCCNSGHVILSYRDESKHSWTEVSVGLDYPQKFNVLPPKDANTDDNRAVSMVLYPAISDLILDCPTYFEATSTYDDPYLPNMSVKSGDRFRFLGTIRNQKDGVERLKVKDETGNTLLLSPECRGHFCPLKDDREYTVQELIDLAPVPRRLRIVIRESDLEVSSQKTCSTFEHAPSGNEYAVVNKASNQSQKSVAAKQSQENLGKDDTASLPKSFSGVIHLHKYESTVTVSPYNCLEITWNIPVTANLKVRIYSQDDYEVPAQRSQLPSVRIPLPLSPNDAVPKFRAPSVPSLKQVVPMNINHFVDIYCPSFPVKARILETAQAHPFFQEMFRGIEEVILYRLEDARRLYVKDAKSDTVYSLSHDLKLSFVEYPEKFNAVSDLLHLPVGTDITILEDIASDFPKPFSLRFGDVIRLTSNTPYFVKVKNANRDCQVIKCDRIDPGGGDSIKLKLPMDLEVSMVMTTDSNSRRMISLHDLLSGTAPIPSKNVASVPDVVDSTVMKDLPVDLKVLKSMKETYVVIASATSTKFPSTVPPEKMQSINSRVSSNEKAASLGLSKKPDVLTNLGLPLTSGIVLAFIDRLDLFDLDVQESEADFIRLSIEKMTLAQFEERERLWKLNSDYEDIEFGSNSTIDECGAVGKQSITRNNSTGTLELKQKNTKMDKVLRFSRALNPKHWRHSKAEPEPLPHPSAMGLMALAAREKEEISNEYHHAQINSVSISSEAFMNESNASSEEEENFYEDVEIGPIKSSTIAATPSRQANVFSGPTHRSLPSRKSDIHSSRSSDTIKQSEFNNAAHTRMTSDASASGASGSTETHTYDVPKPLLKAKNWATNIGNNIGERLSMKPRYDIPRSSKVRDSTFEKERLAAEKTNTAAPSSSKKSAEAKPEVTLTSVQKKIHLAAENRDVGSPPIPPSRRKREKSKHQSNNEEKESSQEPVNVQPVSFDDLVPSTSDDAHLPKPKPRGIKMPLSIEECEPSPRTPQPKSRSGGFTKDPEALSEETHTFVNKSGGSTNITTKDNSRPKPPPKPNVTTHTTV